jgi:hypothetical protein
VSKTFPEPPKLRLVASRVEPAGNVTVIMAGLLDRGRARDKVELLDAYYAYASAGRTSRKRPLPIEEFSTGLHKLCRSMDIAVERKGAHVSLKNVRLKEIEASAG